MTRVRASIFSSETYRGPDAASEPETQAIIGLVERHADSEYHISYHSFGQLLLYPFGFQVNTPSADDPIYVAWAGTDKKPAVQGFNPGVGADLYTTNGEQTDYAAAVRRARSPSRPSSARATRPGLRLRVRVPGQRGLSPARVLINRDFAVASARSATDPDNPVSPVKIGHHPST